VAQLHEALQVAFGWGNDHLNRFEIRGREYAVCRDGGGMMGIHAREGPACKIRVKTCHSAGRLE
jgi:hypothetical protein